MSYFLDRTERLIGKEAINRLNRSHIAVFGLGGVGSYTAEALARSGVGELTLIDNDVINESNVNRQLYALNSTLGRKKTEVAAERVKDINPDCTVHIIDKFYLPESRGEFPLDTFDYICDAVDTVSAKIDLICAGKELDIPVISCMGTGNKLHPELFRIADISETTVCPLARVMRYELKKHGILRQNVVFSPEPPIKNFNSESLMENGDTNSATRKSIPSSISFTPPVAGFITASKVIRDIIDAK